LATTIVGAPRVTSGPGAFSELEDERLVSAIGDGHDAAFEVFYERYHSGVLSFCRHMLGSQEDAEDAVQQTFLATYKQAHAGSPPTHPRAWLYTVARNRCLTTLRARRETSTDTLEPTTEGLAEEVERRHELRELLGDLGRLPEDQRVALLLFELGALDQSEIAETIGCAPKKVKALVYQARTTLAHRAEARNAQCSDIRQQLATLRGGTLNSRALKHHLEICAGCAEFRDEVRRQRARFGLILPVIPLASSHDAVLAALGLGGGASHAAAAGHAGAVHAAAGGGRAARFWAYVARPRVGAIAALTAGAAAGVIVATGGHERHAVAPGATPAQAATPTTKVAGARSARATHHAASKHPGKPAAHATSHPQAQARTAPGAVRHPTNQSQPVPITHQVPKGTPKAPARQTPPSASPKTPPSSPPASRPTNPPATTPPTSTATPPPTPAPESSCGPNGQGGGHAWGHCKGPDGLPPPAEEHSQGQGDPGGPKK
jgi:RNA polymerase sigma factor (sigma-70 family)